MTDSVLHRKWRVGRKAGRTLYLQHGDEAADSDELIGMIDTRDLAQVAVTAVNTRVEIKHRLEMAETLLAYGKSLREVGETAGGRTWEDWHIMVNSYFTNGAGDE